MERAAQNSGSTVSPSPSVSTSYEVSCSSTTVIKHLNGPVNLVYLTQFVLTVQNHNKILKLTEPRSPQLETSCRARPIKYV